MDWRRDLLGLLAGFALAPVTTRALNPITGQPRNPVPTPMRPGTPTSTQDSVKGAAERRRHVGMRSGTPARAAGAACGETCSLKAWQREQPEWW